MYDLAALGDRSRVLRLRLPARSASWSGSDVAADVFGLVDLDRRARLPGLRAVPRGAALDERPGHRPDPRLRSPSSIALAYPLGLYMARVYTTPRFGGRLAAARSSAASTALVRADAKREQDWKSYAKTVLVFSVALLRSSSTRSSGCRAHLFLNPDHLTGRAVAHRAEHGRELRHEHELAVLRRRVRRCRTSRRWPGSRCRTSSRPRSGWPSSPPSSAASRAARPATLGNFWRRPLPLARLHPAAARDRPRRSSSSRRASSQTFHGHATATTLAGRAPDDRARPGRLADRDQAARHERRRLLQLELGRPVREPDRALELPRDARDPADPGGAGLHVREDGARAPRTRWMVFAAMFAHLRDRRRDRAPGRAARLAGAAQLRREHHAGQRPERRQHVGQGGPLRDRQLGPLGDGDDRRLERLGRTAATTRSRPPAAPCRS